MFYLYLFAAVAGCLLVGTSMASGGGQDGGDGADGHAGLSDDGSHSLGDGGHAHQALAVSGAGAGHGDAQLQQGGGHHEGFGGLRAGLGSAALTLFSLQLWTYLLAFGGLTGLLLRTLAHVGEPMAGLCALGVGLGTALTARKVLRRMMATGDSGTVNADRLVGSSAQVLVPATAGGLGKVRLMARGQTIDLLARAQDGGALSEGAEVVILDLNEGVAEVTSDLDDKPKPIDDKRPQAAAPALLLGSSVSKTKG